MDTPAPHQTPAGEDEESFLDDVYARIVDLIEDGRRPDASALAAERPHLLPHVHRLIRVARAVTPLHESRTPSFPGYEVLSRLGAGGMGEVFLCRQSKMGGRLVAVKVLSEAFARSPRRLGTLREEAMALARLRHPGVVDVYEFIVGLDEDDNAVQAFAMQWIEGCSLAQWFARLEAPRPTVRGLNADCPAGRRPAAASAVPRRTDASATEFACRVMARVANIVHAVHREGLLHRDLKPSNILLREDGSPLVSDFGLARDMQHDAGDECAAGFSGTREFASPEQRRGAPLDARSDVYSLGMTLRHTLIEPIPPDVRQIIARATASSPADRYATAADLAADIERFLEHRPVHANPPGPLRRCGMFLHRNRRAVLGTSLGALCALLVAGALVGAVFIAPRRAEANLARARLELLSPSHANVIWNTEWFRLPVDRFELKTDARARAVAAYQAALRFGPWGEWSRGVRREMAVVEGAPPPADDLRLSGLAAYLAGDSVRAIEAWSRMAAREDPDAFIDSALGVLYLVREQHALAYPRLEHACLVYPGVGFLTVYHADAAIGCRELDRAQRLLDEAALLDNHDIHRSLLRVRSDLCLARGLVDQAEELLLRATLKRFDPDTRVPAAEMDEARFDALGSPIAATRLARIRAARGDFDGAANALGSVLARGLGPPWVRAEYTGYVDRWWGSLGLPARRREIRQSLALKPDDPASLVFRLRHAAESDTPEEPGSVAPPGPRARPAAAQPFTILRNLVALARPDSHTSLERASRGEIARRLEVWNLERWNTIAAYSETMKRWQLIVWQSPLPRIGSQIIECLHRGCPERTGRGAAAEAGSSQPAPK